MSKRRAVKTNGKGNGHAERCAILDQCENRFLAIDTRQVKTVELVKGVMAQQDRHTKMLIRIDESMRRVAALVGVRMRGN